MTRNLKHDAGDEYVDVAKAARFLGVSASFLNKLRVTGGGPPYVKIGSVVRYDVQTTREWAAARTRRLTSDG
jgi:hypothetical protein